MSQSSVMKKILAATAVGCSVSLTACGSGSTSSKAATTSPVSASTQQSAATASSSSSSSHGPTAPTGASSPTRSTKTVTVTAAPNAGKTADQSIRKANFANSTFRTQLAGTITLANGMATKTDATTGDTRMGLPGTANGFPSSIPVTYGDVNGDGIEDAVVELDGNQGNGVSIEFSVWLGHKSGPPTQLGGPFITTGRCGYTITKMSIDSTGLITAGGGGMGQDCADSGTGPAYTATYRVVGDAVKTLTAPPQ